MFQSYSRLPRQMGSAMPRYPSLCGTCRRSRQLRNEQVISHNLLFLRQNLIEVPRCMYVPSTQSASVSCEARTVAHSPATEELSIARSEPQERGCGQLERIGCFQYALQPEARQDSGRSWSLDAAGMNCVDGQFRIVCEHRYVSLRGVKRALRVRTHL